MVHLTDTLLYDSVKIAAYQSDKRFDYNSQLEIPEINLAEIIFRWISRFFRRFVNVEAADTITWWFLILFFIAVVVLVVYFIYKQRPELFIREKKKPVYYEVEEESIYGVNFENEINKALSVNDYRTAIRILYLQTVRYLADKQYIDWQIYKVPTEYIYELKHAGSRPPFRQFTNHFLEVRYGNYKATNDLFERMKTLHDQLTKGEPDEA